jgi:cyclophilin family peptidyl-prolyl cis-trans isomerase
MTQFNRILKIQASKMKAANRSNSHRNNEMYAPAWVLSGLVLVTLAFVVWQLSILEGPIAYVSNGNTPVVSHIIDDAKLRSERVNKEHRPIMVAAIFDESPWENHNMMNAKMRKIRPNACGYTSGIFNLTDNEFNPQAGDRHMITPPQGGKLSLVCCETTKGNMAMVVHHKWAPIGAAHFLDMVKSGYFDSTVPMMRCIKEFLCQFGLNGDPVVTKKFRGNLKDDPNWLPEGKKFRENKLGVKRFAKGYLAYAGGGQNTRGNQFIVALHNNGPLAGGSPWEVPWGELVGRESFKTLSKIYTGYGDDGPPQGKLGNQGMTKEMKKEFPKLDYINTCMVVDETEAADIPQVGLRTIKTNTVAPTSTVTSSTS